jgi:hypothetical protein
VYGKTNLGAGTISARRKRTLAIAGSAVVLGLAGFGVWSAVAPDTDGAGCVNVTVPSSTGGATLHYCGAQARSFCHGELAAPASDQLAARALPACRQAGLDK